MLAFVKHLPAGEVGGTRAPPTWGRPLHPYNSFGPPLGHCTPTFIPFFSYLGQKVARVGSLWPKTLRSLHRIPLYTTSPSSPTANFPNSRLPYITLALPCTLSRFLFALKITWNISFPMFLSNNIIWLRNVWFFLSWNAIDDIDRHKYSHFRFKLIYQEQNMAEYVFGTLSYSTATIKLVCCSCFLYL